MRSGVAILLLLAGCARAERKVQAEPAALDPAAAAVRAARAVPPVPHRLVEKASATVRDDDRQLESLAEESFVERAEGGALHAGYNNSRDHGREIFAVGGTIWVRPRYGLFHRRPPAEPDEAERAAAEIGGLLGAQLELVAPALEVADGGAASPGGRPAHKLTLRRAATPAAPRAARPEGGWRDTLEVEAVDGELVVDDATGAILAGRLEARVAFDRDGDRLEMLLSSSREVTPGAVTITPPAEDASAPTPYRSTEFDDRNELLSGLAPPGRKSPAPAKGAGK